MTYHHLWHWVYLSLSCGQPLVLLWALNDQLLLWSFMSPSLHCQQLWWDISKLIPRKKKTVSISVSEKKKNLVLEKKQIVYLFLSDLSSSSAWTALTENSVLTTRLRRWPLLQSTVQPEGVKHPLSHIYTHKDAMWPHTIHLHCDRGLTKENKTSAFLKYYSLVRDCPRLVWDSWKKTLEQTWGVHRQQQVSSNDESAALIL